MAQLIAIITPRDAAHGGLGFLAVANIWWLNFLNPVVQIGVTLDGTINSLRNDVETLKDLVNKLIGPK